MISFVLHAKFWALLTVLMKVHRQHCVNVLEHTGCLICFTGIVVFIYVHAACTDWSVNVLFSVGRDSLSAENVDIEDYEIQTRNALMGEVSNDFEYELKESCYKDDKSLQLIWKKVVEKDRIKVYVLYRMLLSTFLDAWWIVYALFIACLIIALFTECRGLCHCEKQWWLMLFSFSLAAYQWNQWYSLMLRYQRCSITW